MILLVATGFLTCGSRSTRNPDFIDGSLQRSGNPVPFHGNPENRDLSRLIGDPLGLCATTEVNARF